MVEDAAMAGAVKMPRRGGRAAGRMAYFLVVVVVVISNKTLYIASRFSQDSFRTQLRASSTVVAVLLYTNISECPPRASAAMAARGP